MPIIRFRTHVPKIDKSVFVAPSASIIGRVKISKDASVWFGSVIRGDFERIEIGRSSNIQDGTIIHVDSAKPCLIGDYVHVGHHSNLHGCIIEDGCLIGIGAIILSGARIGSGSIIGSGSVVLENSLIPKGSLAVGIPARVVRKLTPKEKTDIRKWVDKYKKLAAYYRNNLARP